uniref:Uncharacterized protein n=1 Tax=Romanomermis culicivorax TaxID=13658 RepID=A0A915IK53_ROMCU
MVNADLRSEEIDGAVVQIIAVDDPLFSVVENPGFINLITKFLNMDFYGLGQPPFLGPLMDRVLAEASPYGKGTL